MRKNKNELKVSAGAPPLPIKRTDTSDDPSESHHGGRLSRPRKSIHDLTLTEIRSIEARVRKELYP